MLTSENIRLFSEIGSYIVTIVGLPIAIIFFILEKRAERIEREYGTYNALDDKDLEFLMLCLNNTKLNIYNSLGEVERKLSGDEKKQQAILFDMLTSIFERAFLMYKNHHKHIRTKQWNGWDTFVHDWMRDKSFYSSWNEIGSQPVG